MPSKINKIISGKSGEIYRTLAANTEYKRPHLYIKTLYKKYQLNYEGDQNINGRIFEYLVCETLVRSGITPLYYQATFEQIPSVVFDIVLYDQYKPVLFTTKTSLRERYKQADLEGIALRQVYRRAEIYLITMSSDEASNVSNKIEDGSIVGISECLIASKPEYSRLLQDLKQRNFSKAVPITPLKGAHLIS